MRWLVVIGLIGCGALRAAAGTVTSFDDIQYWVGSGMNRGAVVIDWTEGNMDRSLVWGFRWDGVATGYSMLHAVVTADPRLFMKIGGYGGDLGASLYGVGYGDCDCFFGLDDDTVFDAGGIAIVEGSSDGAMATDPGDTYREGWFLGLWIYGVSNGNPYDGGNWKNSVAGMSTRTLADGDWDSWQFTATFNFSAFAQNPHAATQTLAGDFDCDGDVDGADFVAWQTNFPGTSGHDHATGDADCDGDVDGADFAAWQSSFNTPSASGSPVPEPSGIMLAAIGVAGVSRALRVTSRRKRTI